MKNIYQRHLDSLFGIEFKGEPFVSLFIPLRYTEFPQSRMFNYLIKAANLLLTKEGYPKLEMEHPDWGRWLKQGTVTLAIYKANGLIWHIPLPVKMPPRVVVADSFHVKPLLAASICQQEAMLLHFSEVGASLYRVSSGEEKLIDTYLPTSSRLKGTWLWKLSRIEWHEFLDFIKLEVKGHSEFTTQFLTISGDFDQLSFPREYWRDLKFPVHEVKDSPRVLYPTNSLAMTRIRLAEEINGSFSRQVRMIIDEVSGPVPDIAELGERILKKEIKRLCVSLEDMHFGDLNDLTGRAVEKESQANTKDDDILDDLIELALREKVQVSVVPRKFLPAGRTYIAS